ncbi:hypothetical protein GGR57DRAFT_467310 [Xylariaceae sp. FL1272]|nr:hypothetical protein GGR57DRAFT_467310 [Xylariaceae sp. FL1272]
MSDPDDIQGNMPSNNLTISPLITVCHVSPTITTQAPDMEDDKSEGSSMTHDSELSLDYRFCDYSESSDSSTSSDDTDSGYDADTPFDSDDDSEDDSGDDDDEDAHGSDASNHSLGSDERYSTLDSDESADESEYASGPVYRRDHNRRDLEGGLEFVYHLTCLAVLTYGGVQATVMCAWMFVSGVWFIVS